MQKQTTRRGFTQKNKNTVIKNGHFRKFLSGISLIRICKRTGQPSFAKQTNQKGDPRLQLSGMTPNFITVRGFTLIELLVVVLIIGILAAVALPQYNKAVKKAQGREVIVAINALDKAVASFAIANGGLCYAIDGYHCADNMRVFDIELPELKHFSSGGFPTREGSHIDDKDPFSTTFQSKVGNASLAVQWDSISGQRISQTCTGDDCAAYFGGTCEVTFTKTCNNSPISDENFQHCPTNLRGENTITTCELDI